MCFDLSYHMIDKKFDHISLTDTRRHWTSLPEDYAVPQRFHGHFMSLQLDSTTAYNINDFL